MKKNKKLLIDVNAVVPYYVFGKVNGIGRTTLELVQALAKINDIPFDIELFAQNMKGVGGKNIDTAFKSHHLYLPNRSAINKLLGHIPVREMFTGYDLMHIPSNFEYVYKPEKCIVTIHDAMFFSYPEDFLGHDFARKNYPQLAQRCKAVITCSENSKREIANYMDVKESKIFVCPWGVDHELFKIRSKKTNRFTGNDPFFISVSCDIGRKNTISVIKAYSIFAKNNPEHHLVLVWKNPSVEAILFVKQEGLSDKVHFVQGLSNEELADMYSSATATFFPSKYEGFGLPILESMASGTPVVTCKNSSLEEVGGNAAIYVEPEDIRTMSIWMENFENRCVDYEKIKMACIKQASLFTWEKCAEKTIDVYKKCLESL